MREVLAVATRVFAVVGKEIVETIRRPAAVFSLVVGPLLLIFVFGAAYDGTPRPLRTILVVPEGSGLPSEPAAYVEEGQARVDLVGVTPDLESARSRIASREADLLLIAPADLAARFRAGEQSVIGVEYSIVDPIRVAQADLVAGQVEAAANRLLVERAVAQGESYAVVAEQAGAEPIPPEVVATPMRAETRNLAPSQPGIVAFFGPAAVVLVLQHLAVALLALSIVRERSRGRLEAFHIAPVSAIELLTGKGIAFAFIGAFVGLTTVALLVSVFSVPMLGGAVPVGIGMALTLVAALALGALVAGVSDSERQAVQLTLLLLLASVFFSGFVLPIDEFRSVGQAFASLLPVTHGIIVLQESMLRGGQVPVGSAAALVALAMLAGLAAWLLFRRAMVRA
jgi:ABC-2 type transport system permease protein